MENFLRYLWNVGGRRYLANCWAKARWIASHETTVQTGLHWTGTFFAALHGGRLSDALWRFTNDDLVRLRGSIDEEISRRIEREREYGRETHARALESFIK